MFTKRQLENYAEVLIWGLGAERARRFKPYDTVVVRVNIDSLPLAEVVHRRLIERRLNVVFRMLPPPGIEKDFYVRSDKAQRQFISPGEKELYASCHGLIALNAPASLTHLKDVDPGRIGEAAIAKKSLRRIWDRREEQGHFSWTLCTYPTGELAANAGLSLKAYAAQVAKACLIDEKDPVAKWRQIYRDCQGIKSWLKSLDIDIVRVETGNMDLEIKLGERRRFQGISGANIPSFEVFTSPDWRGTRGTYYANLPSYRNGNIVQGVKLEFKEGKAVGISAARGEEFVKKTLATDAGARQLGEFSLTDVRFSRIDKFMADTLFDENFGGEHGNCHVAMGASYSDTFDGDPARLGEAAKKKLGFNDSSVHWDIINTEDKRVTARLKSGRTIAVYEKGKFQY
ncbi:MAG TPA: aminopeptidase [Elusimicrobia bacterium]|nr:aminopeptidase [Elusimicrobiota bacterium]HBT62525.1 aminopeptidase [Elusimicrobiota bacterium]